MAMPCDGIIVRRMLSKGIILHKGIMLYERTVLHEGIQLCKVMMLHEGMSNGRKPCERMIHITRMLREGRFSARG